MSSTTRKKTGGRVKGTPNKATLAKLQDAAPPDGDPVISPDSRRRARGTAPAESRKVDATEAAAYTDPRNLLNQLDGMTVDPKFPRYKLVRISELVPYARNARTHSPEQVEKIAASIREFGWTNPILTDGKRGIVAGHGRVLAAELLGMDVAPSIELGHLSEAQRRAYIIADNKLALDAGWDDDLLRLELGELREDGFDLNLTGFAEPELDKLFALDPAPPDGFQSFDENIETEHTCPSCGYKWSGGKTTATPAGSDETEGDC